MNDDLYKKFFISDIFEHVKHNSENHIFRNSNRDFQLLRFRVSIKG